MQHRRNDAAAVIQPMDVNWWGCLLLARSGHTETICYLFAFGGKADIGRCIAPIISAAFDPKRSSAGA
jgi:hypothetical protein